MTHPAVQRARELAKKATPGPWETDGRQVVEGEYRGPEGNEMVAWFFKPDGTRVENYEANSEFIAAARTLLPELAEAYETLEARLGRLDEFINELGDERDRVVALNTRLTDVLRRVMNQIQGTQTVAPPCFREALVLLAETDPPTFHVLDPDNFIRERGEV